MKKILILICLLIASNAWALSKTVCNTGNGCDYTSISAALTGLGTGNHTITVKAPYTGNDDITISQSGTDNTNRLTIKVNSGDTITVKRFTIKGSNIVIDGFRFNGASGSTGDASIVAQGDNITVQNNNIVNATVEVGGVITRLTVPYVNNLLIQNNNITGSLGHVFWIYANNSVLKNNTASNSGMDFIRLWGNNNLIQGNTVHDFNCDGENHPDFVQTWGMDAEVSTNMVIEGNFVYNSCIQPCNLSNDYDTHQHNWTFRNNIYYHVGGGANVGIPNVAWYNNIFYDSNYVNDGVAIGFLNGGGFQGIGGIVENNIFIGCTRSNSGWYAGDTGAQPTADYNFVAGLSPGFSAKTGFSETHGINGGNPRFVNGGGTNATDYALQSGSPLIDKSATISGFSNDYAGTTRPQGNAWDIGAFETIVGLRPNQPVNLLVY